MFKFGPVCSPPTTGESPDNIDDTDPIGPFTDIFVDVLHGLHSSANLEVNMSLELLTL